RAARNLGALGLGDAACNRDRRRRAVLALQAADVRIDLFCGFLANMTGIEDNQIGVGAFGCGRITLSAEHLGHALAVIDVHLTAEGLDVKSLWRVGFHRRAIGDSARSRKSAPSLPYAR